MVLLAYLWGNIAWEHCSTEGFFTTLGSSRHILPLPGVQGGKGFEQFLEQGHAPLTNTDTRRVCEAALRSCLCFGFFWEAVSGHPLAVPEMRAVWCWEHTSSRQQGESTSRARSSLSVRDLQSQSGVWRKIRWFPVITLHLLDSCSQILLRNSSWHLCLVQPAINRSVVLTSCFRLFIFLFTASTVNSFTVGLLYWQFQQWAWQKLSSVYSLSKSIVICW